MTPTAAGAAPQAAALMTPRAAAPAAWMEASCPACIGVSLLADRVPALAELTAPDPVRPEPGDEQRVLVS